MATSPNWKKPAEILRLHRKKRRTLSIGRSLSSSSLDTLTRESTPPNAVQGPVKRKNPFKSTPSKKVHLSQETFASENGESSLLNVLSGQPVKFSLDPHSDEEKSVDFVGRFQTPTSECCQSPEVCKTPSQQSEDGPVAAHRGQSNCPTDWSLKTKIRFASDKPFSWCTPLKTAEEAQAISAHLRCDYKPLSQGLAAEQMLSKVACHQCCMVWQHPNLPWLKLFPRITSDNKIGKKTAVNQDDDIHKALLVDWTESFSCAFHMVRTGQCPYLYMCAHQFSVLFRAAGTAGHKQMQAVVTPTSRGFREAVKAEGIEFSLPLDRRRTSGGNTANSPATADGPQTQNKENISISPQCVSGQVVKQDMSEEKTEAPREDADEEEEADICHTDDGASTWLQNLGLDTGKYRSLDPTKVKLQRDYFREIDNRPESTLLVEGPDTLALLNYLLNCRSCVATTGVQAGIPPTLLAPVAFKGATLKKLQVKAGQLRQHGETHGSTKQAYMCEVTGPILPHTVHGLASLFSQTHSSFTANFSIYEPSTSLNGSRGLAPIDPQSEPFNTTTSTEDDSELVKQLAECGVTQRHMQAIAQDNHLGKQAIRELSFEDGLYNWVT